jgi:hypothetical protein
VALLVTKEWELSYVTPLYQFRHTQLKSYSKHLSSFIVSEKQQGLAIEVGQELGFKVNFSVVLGLAETDEDAETVFIQVRFLLSKCSLQYMLYSSVKSDCGVQRHLLFSSSDSLQTSVCCKR